MDSHRQMVRPNPISRGAFFEITRTPPDEKRRRQIAEKIEAEEASCAPAILKPGAFGQIPFLTYENIPLGRTVSRLLIIRNPSQKVLPVRFEKVPKPEKGFDFNQDAFELAPKCQATIEVSWTPQNGTPLREAIILRLGNLKAQVNIIATAKCPPPPKNQKKVGPPRRAASAPKKPEQPPQPLPPQKTFSGPPVFSALPDDADDDSEINLKRQTFVPVKGMLPLTQLPIITTPKSISGPLSHPQQDLQYHLDEESKENFGATQRNLSPSLSNRNLRSIQPLKTTTNVEPIKPPRKERQLAPPPPPRPEWKDLSIPDLDLSLDASIDASSRKNVGETFFVTAENQPQTVAASVDTSTAATFDSMPNVDLNFDSPPAVERVREVEEIVVESVRKLSMASKMTTFTEMAPPRLSLSLELSDLDLTLSPKASRPSDAKKVDEEESDGDERCVSAGTYVTSPSFANLRDVADCDAVKAQALGNNASGPGLSNPDLSGLAPLLDQTRLKPARLSDFNQVDDISMLIANEMRLSGEANAVQSQGSSALPPKRAQLEVEAAATKKFSPMTPPNMRARPVALPNSTLGDVSFHPPSPTDPWYCSTAIKDIRLREEVESERSSEIRRDLFGQTTTNSKTETTVFNSETIVQKNVTHVVQPTTQSPSHSIEDSPRLSMIDEAAEDSIGSKAQEPRSSSTNPESTVVLNRTYDKDEKSTDSSNINKTFEKPSTPQLKETAPSPPRSSASSPNADGLKSNTFCLTPKTQKMRLSTIDEGSEKIEATTEKSLSLIDEENSNGVFENKSMAENSIKNLTFDKEEAQLTPSVTQQPVVTQISPPTNKNTGTDEPEIVKNHVFTIEISPPRQMSSPARVPPSRVAANMAVLGAMEKRSLPSTRRSVAPARPPVKVSVAKAAKSAETTLEETVVEKKKEAFFVPLVECTPAPSIKATPAPTANSTMIIKSQSRVAAARQAAVSASRERKPSTASGRSTAKTASRLTLLRPAKVSASLIHHPNPFAARNMYYDERWIEKQENGFKKWLNFVLTPPEGFECTDNEKVLLAPGKLDVAKLWTACSKDVRVPRAPTREVLSMRAYSARRQLKRLRCDAFTLWQSPAIAPVIVRLETEIEKQRLAIRADRQLNKDLGMKKKLLVLLLSYNPLWLHIGLETVFGEILPVNNLSDIVGISQFILQRLLSNPDILAQFAHPTVPHHYMPGYELALRQFTLKKFLQLVFFLDQAKLHRLIQHNPCLFAKDSPIKASREMLTSFSRDFLSGEGDIVKHLAFLGYKVTHQQVPLDEFDYAVTNIAMDLRCGVRLSRVMEILTTNSSLSTQLRMPAVSRLQKIHNVEVALNALKASRAGLPENLTPKDIVDGHMEKTLNLLWHIIFGFQLDLILDADRLNKELHFLEKSLAYRVRIGDSQARRGLHFIGECKRRALVPSSSMAPAMPADTKNDWTLAEKMQLLLQWARLVCAHYAIEIENFSVSFSDGRALCYLLHHYYPAFVPQSEIREETTQQQQQRSPSKTHNDSLNDSLTYNYGRGSAFDSKAYEACLKNEKENFKLVHSKVNELGGVPMIIRSSEMSNTIPDQKVTATFLAYLAVRLIDLSTEMSAARTIQLAWKHFVATKREKALKVKYNVDDESN